MDLVELRCDGTKVVVAPELGGRLLSLKEGDREFLWVNEELLDEALAPRVRIHRPSLGSGFPAWQNWGGDKTWLAPQGWDDPTRMWPGPPDGILDAGPYTVTRMGPQKIRLSSAPQPACGIRITREISLWPNVVRVTSTVTNVTDHPVEWAAWQVMQLGFGADDIGSPTAGVEVGATDGDVTVLSDPAIPFDVQYGESSLRILFQDNAGKLGFPSANGVARVVWSDGACLEMRFDVHCASVHPDRSPFQLWMQSPEVEQIPGAPGLQFTDRLIELEATSPVTLLMPGESVSLSTGTRAFVTPPGAADSARCDS